MAVTLQSVDVSTTTGLNGRFTYEFDKPVDQVLVSVSSPEIDITAVASVTGDKQVTVRCFKSGVLLAGRRVVVTLLGVTHTTTAKASKGSG